MKKVDSSTTNSCYKQLETESLVEGGCLNITYCDFMKALMFFHKLELHNTGAVYSRWVESFLDIR